MEARFATLLTCIDGRIQRPLEAWVKERFGVDYVDVLTEPGVDGRIPTMDAQGMASLTANVQLSRRAHGSAVLVVAAHSDCAGNPVSDDEHYRQLRAGLTRLGQVLPDVHLVAVHAGRCGVDCWSPREVADSGTRRSV